MVNGEAKKALTALGFGVPVPAGFTPRDIPLALSGSLAFGAHIGMNPNR